MTLALVFGGNGEKIKTKYKAVRDDLDCDVYRGLSDLYIGSKARGISYNRVIILSSCIGNSSLDELAEYVRLNPATTVILLARKGTDDALATRFVNTVRSSFAVAMLVTSTTQVILEEALNLDAYDINEKYGIRVEHEISLRSEQVVEEEKPKTGSKVEAPKKKGFFQRFKEANEAAKKQLEQQRVERQNQQIQEQQESQEDYMEETADTAEYENDGYEEGYDGTVGYETGESQYSDEEYEKGYDEEATDFELQTEEFSELPESEASSDDGENSSQDFEQSFTSFSDEESINDVSDEDDDSSFFSAMSQSQSDDSLNYSQRGMSSTNGVDMSSLLEAAAADSQDDLDIDFDDSGIADIDFGDLSIPDEDEQESSDDFGSQTEEPSYEDGQYAPQSGNYVEENSVSEEVSTFRPASFDEVESVQIEAPVEPVFDGKKTKRGFFGFGKKKKSNETPTPVPEVQSIEEGMQETGYTEEPVESVEVVEPVQTVTTAQESTHRVPRRRPSFGSRQPVQEAPVEESSADTYEEFPERGQSTGFSIGESGEGSRFEPQRESASVEDGQGGRAVPAVRPPSDVVEVDDLFDDDIEDIASLDSQYRAAEDSARVKVVEVEKIVEREVYKESSVKVKGGNKSALAGIFKGKLHKIILVTGSAGSGVTTLAWDLAKFMSKGCPVLYVDGNVDNHGILNYIDYERFADYEDQQKQGVRLCRNPKAFSRCVIRFDRNIDLLVSDFFVTVDDDQYETMQSTLTDVAREYGVVIVDVPLSKIHLCEEIISAGNIVMTCELSKRGVMNLCSDFNASTLRDKYKRTIVSRGTLVYTKVAGKGFNEKDLKKYVESIIEFDEDDANFLTMTSARREKDIKDSFVEEILEG